MKRLAIVILGLSVVLGCSVGLAQPVPATDAPKAEKKGGKKSEKKGSKTEHKGGKRKAEQPKAQ